MNAGYACERIGIVGTGRVAQAFGLGLHPFSRAPILFLGRSREGIGAALAAVPGSAVAEGYGVLARSCDLVIIAVSDDALEPVVADLARVGALPERLLICHVSGRSGAAMLDPLRKAGAATAAIHPVMTFVGDPENEVRRMAGARFAVTVSDEATRVRAHMLVERLGGVAVDIAEPLRALYHGALCHAANHLVTLLTGAADALTAAGVEEPGAMLGPLVRAAMENALANGFAALSGPLLRGDAHTIGGHLSAFAEHRPEILPAYRAMALATLDALERSGTDVSAMRKRLVPDGPRR
jgi:predicted short-subunit dehydrogenase-like oxidoreductase (DUF2520 family)